MNPQQKSTLIHTAIATAMTQKILTGPPGPRNTILAAISSGKRKDTPRPGILDRITACESREDAHLLWHEFLDSANSVSSKTHNRATRLLATLDFPLP